VTAVLAVLLGLVVVQNVAFARALLMAALAGRAKHAAFSPRSCSLYLGRHIGRKPGRRLVVRRAVVATS
jgi:hypothetical protein